jgi:hypothetical protein
MAISDKLTYLNTTKGKIKDAINLTNANILSEDTFRSYADKLKLGLIDIINNGTDDLYDSFPKTTGTGTEIALNDTYEAPMEIGLNGNTHQDSYTGKNLLNIANLTAITKSGITLTKNNDGTITLNGTASADANFGFAIDNIVATSSYKVQLYKKGGSFTNNYVSIYMSVDSAFSDFDLLSLTSSDFISMSLGNKTYTYAQIKVNSGVICNNLVVGCQVVSDASITEFEKYTGKQPSPSPDYPQEIEVVTGDNTINVANAINIFDMEKYANENSNYFTYSKATGLTAIKKDNRAMLNVGFPIEVLSNTTYYIKTDTTERLFIAQYNSNGNWITSGEVYNGDSFMPNTNTRSIRIKVADTLTTYPTVIGNVYISTSNNYQSKNYEISLGSIELCKIGNYQDYIYKENNKWYKHSEIGKVVLDGSETWATANNQVGTSSFYRYSCNDFQDTNKYLANTPYMSDNFKYSSNTLIEQNVIGNTTASNTNRLWITIDTTLTGGTATTDFKTWLSTHNTIVYYVLATPTYEIITNETLISQLEELKKAKSVDDKTFISQINEQLPFVLDVSALSKN